MFFLEGRFPASVAVAWLVLTSAPASAAIFAVGSEAQLRNAINAANTNGEASNTIVLTGNINLTGALPTLGLSGQNRSLLIDLSGKTISGQNQNRIFFANSGSISIRNGTLADGMAKGGDGGNAPVTAGGGGMGAGGALFVQAGAAVTINNVSFDGNTAVGGKGGASTGGVAAAAGGGGMGGNGGGGSDNITAVGYGGGGAFAGQNGNPSSSLSGGDGGGPLGGAGGATTGSPGGAGGAFSGGGGAGAYGQPANGGAGGFGGGGGGGTGLGTQGGDGGYGGGGGGAVYGPGGNGGFGGGAGLGIGTGFQAAPGSAGYGGGASSTSNSAGAGAGGGAGFGGAVFVREGGSLIIGGNGTFDASGVQGGAAGGTGASSGLAAGAGLFLQNSGVTFNPGAGETQTVFSIADSTGNGGDKGTVTKTGDGTLVLIGTNTYSGGTNIVGGVVSVGSNVSLGAVNGGLTFDGGTLRAASGFSMDRAATLDDGGGTFDVAAGATLTESGVISGAGALTKIGDGTLVLSGTNTYGGGTTLADGTLRVENNSALGTGLLDVTGASTLDYASGVDIANAIRLGANLTANVDVGTATQRNHISGSGSLTKTGDGTLVMRNLGIYSGGTTISGGILDVAHQLASNIDALGTGAISINAGTLRTSVTGTLANDLSIGPGSVATIAAATGTRATLTGGILINDGSLLQFGSATDNGTIVASFTNLDTVSTAAMAVNGGVLRAGNDYLAVITGNVSSTTVAAGAVLDFADHMGLGPFAGVRNLQGAGEVVIGTDAASTLRVQAGNFSGVISGAGGLLRSLSDPDVGDTLILSGTNTYQGNTTIDGGTLQLGNGGTTGSIVSPTVSLLNGGTLAFDRSDTYEFDGAINGNGGVVKNGRGITVLDAVNTYNGATTVNAGILDVEGSIANSATTVKGAGALIGSGTLGKTTIESGAIHAPGTLGVFQTVEGDYKIEENAQLNIVVSGTGESSGLVVKGSVDVTNAILNIIAAPGSYAYATPYLLIDNQGANAVAGQFQTPPLLNLAFLDASLDYAARDGNDVELTLLRNDVSFVDVTQTRNQAAVAGAIEPPGGPIPLISAIVPLSADQARQAFDALSGEAHATVAGVLLDDSRFTRDAILARLAQASHSSSQGDQVASLGEGGPTTVAGDYDAPMMGLGMGGGSLKDSPSQVAPASRLAFWTQGFGSWGDFDGDGNAASADRTIGGFLSGVDAKLERGWRLGAAVGYSQTSIGVDARLSSASIDSYHAAAYAGGPVGALALRSGGVWTWHDIDTERTIAFLGFVDHTKSSYDANVGQVFGEAALPFEAGRAAVEPFAGIAYVHLDTDAFKESGGLAALNGQASDADVGYSTVGIRVASRLEWQGLEVTPRASIAWQHAFGDLTPDASLALNAGGAGFKVSGVPLAEDTALIEAGLDLKLTDEATLGVSYSGQLGRDVEDHGLNGRVTWRF